MCQLQLFPSSHIWDHLLTSSSKLKPPTPSKPNLQSFGDWQLEVEDFLMDAWKSSMHMSMPIHIQTDTIMWFDDNSCLSTLHVKHLQPIIFHNLVDEWPTWKLTLTPLPHIYLQDNKY